MSDDDDDDRRHPLRKLHRQQQRHALVKAGIDPDRRPAPVKRIDPRTGEVVEIIEPPGDKPADHC